jgi:protein CpxP
MTKIRTIAIAGALALSAAVAAPMVLAQDAHRGPGFGRRGGPGAMGDIGLALRQLDLSDAQREQVRGIMNSHQAAFTEIGDRLRTAHQGLQEAVSADTVDEAAIRAKSTEVAAVQADAAVLRARVRQEVVSILTAEQQAKAKELRAAAETRMKERAGKMRERRERRSPPR